MIKPFMGVSITPLLQASAFNAANFHPNVICLRAGLGMEENQL
jgi:hypothetical protein